MKLLPALLLIVLTATPFLSVFAAENQVTLRFITFPKVSKPQTFTILCGKDCTETIEVSSNTISQPLFMPQLKKWTIGEVVMGPDGKSTNFKVLGKTKSRDSKHQIIVIVTGMSPSNDYHLIALDEHNEGLTLGKTLIVNTSNKRIGGIIGGEKLNISSGAHKLIEPKPNDTGRYFHAKLYYEKEGHNKYFFSSNWPYSNQSRVMTFFYDDAVTKQLRLHTIRDFKK